jgi:hypothetical protein
MRLHTLASCAVLGLSLYTSITLTATNQTTQQKTSFRFAQGAIKPLSNPKQ